MNFKQYYSDYMAQQQQYQQANQQNIQFVGQSQQQFQQQQQQLPEPNQKQMTNNYFMANEETRHLTRQDNNIKRCFGREIPNNFPSNSSQVLPQGFKNSNGMKHEIPFVKTRSQVATQVPPISAAVMQRQMSVEEFGTACYDENIQPNVQTARSRNAPVTQNQKSISKFDAENTTTTTTQFTYSNQRQSLQGLQQQQQQQQSITQQQPQVQSNNWVPPQSMTAETDSVVDTFPKDRLESNPVYQHARGIYDYLKTTENNYSARGTMNEMQTEITVRMRAILVDWLVDVHLKFKLQPETLFLAVNLIDRFIERKVVAKDQLQLLGSTAMFVACKIEEIYPPELNDFVFICDNLYTKEQILAKEGELITLINFDLTYTSPLRFLHRFCYLNNSTESQFLCAQYMLELGLLEYDLVGYSASNLAASALYLVNKIFELSPPWCDDLRAQSNYESDELKTCAKDFWVALSKANESQVKFQKSVSEADAYEESLMLQLAEWYKNEKNIEASQEENRQIGELEKQYVAKKQAIEKNVKEYRNAIVTNSKSLIAVIKKFSHQKFAEAAKLLFSIQGSA